MLRDTFVNKTAVQNFELRLKRKTNKITCRLFEELINQFFGLDEKKLFLLFIQSFKSDFQEVIGYRVTEMCTPKNLQRLKECLLTEIREFPYSDVKHRCLTERLLTDFNAKDLSEKNFEIICNSYINDKKYTLLLGTADFAQSFLTSEWLYKKYYSSNELDNTFIITGYLKSIEQLLWDIIKTVGKGRYIRDVEIQEENQTDIDKTLGALEKFLTSWENEDLLIEHFGSNKYFIRNYLKNQIAKWRTQSRNGYFHKHQLTKESINKIREETFFLYFLILGSIKLSEQDIKLIIS